MLDPRTISVSTISPTVVMIDGTLTIFANDFSTTGTECVTISSPGGIVTANWNGVTRIATPGITTISIGDESTQIGTINEDNNVGGIVVTTSSKVAIRSRETIHVIAKGISTFVADGIVDLAPGHVAITTYEGATLAIVDEIGSF